jgi:hypothetical protein
LSFFCQESIKGTVSYNDLAAKISTELNHDASRQAYFYRTKDEAVEFFKMILATVMRNRGNLPDIASDQSGVIRRFKRILIQDSTIVRLPHKLYEVFSGVRNETIAVCNARIQGVYDLVSGRFVSFSIDTYSENDLVVANRILAQEGDLVLRDRGYFSTSAITNMQQKGADSISRYKHKTTFFDAHSLTEIDLLEHLRKHGTIDMQVRLDPDNSTVVRILATPVPEEVANIRRMKAKKEAKSRGCSYELLQLLGWTIFITTIESKDISIAQIALLYSLRWRIECIFKTWKSNFGFDKIHNVSERQLRVLLYARFIMVTLLYERLYTPMQKIMAQELGVRISLMKLMRFISRNILQAILFIDTTHRKAAVNKIARYCAYDKRRRSSFIDAVEAAILT